MINRLINRLINPSKKMSFFLIGPRGTGKSTWLQENFHRDQHLWIDSTNPKEERRFSFISSGRQSYADYHL